MLTAQCTAVCGGMDQDCCDDDVCREGSVCIGNAESGACRGTVSYTLPCACTPAQSFLTRRD